MSETAFANREKPVFKNPQQPTSNISQSLPNSQLRLLRASCCFPEQLWLRNGKTGFIQYDIIKWAKGAVQSEPAEAQISVFFSPVWRSCSKKHQNPIMQQNKEFHYCSGFSKLPQEPQRIKNCFHNTLVTSALNFNGVSL